MIPRNKQQLRSRMSGVNRILCKSEFSEHVVTYIGLCIYRGVQLKSLSTHRKKIDSIMTAPPPSISPSNILPQRSSHCTFIPPRKKKNRAHLKNTIISGFFFVYSLSTVLSLTLCVWKLRQPGGSAHCYQVLHFNHTIQLTSHTLHKGESNGKLPLKTCPGCSVPEPYQSPD